MRSRAGRWLGEQLLGIDRRRCPPAFVRRTLTRQFGEITPFEDSGRATRVLLFPDTFTNYNEPEIGLAAVRLLNRAGCSVTLGPVALRCCGRPLISNGLLYDAVNHARHNVDGLYPWAETRALIVACEPSCILTIKDDYPALLRGEGRRRAEAVAERCRTFEEMLDELLGNARNGKPLRFRAGPKRLLVQGHCHQRSLVGMSAALRLLRRVPGAEVVDLDAGCCGMAGSFGYEQEHYEVSRMVGEQRLFPAVREAAPDDVIVASGMSCRLQIAHFTGRAAVHPATLLDSLLD
jgi:Fe-S oxidoreductase